LWPGILMKNTPKDLGQVPDGLEGSESIQKAGCGALKGARQTPVDFTAKEHADKSFGCWSPISV